MSKLDIYTTDDFPRGCVLLEDVKEIQKENYKKSSLRFAQAEQLQLELGQMKSSVTTKVNSLTDILEEEAFEKPALNLLILL